MFVKTDPQKLLLECEFLLPPEKWERLKKSWVAFRRAHDVHAVKNQHATSIVGDEGLFLDLR